MNAHDFTWYCKVDKLKNSFAVRSDILLDLKNAQISNTQFALLSVASRRCWNSNWKYGVGNDWSLN